MNEVPMTAKQADKVKELIAESSRTSKVGYVKDVGYSLIAVRIAKDRGSIAPWLTYVINKHGEVVQVV